MEKKTLRKNSRSLTTLVENNLGVTPFVKWAGGKGRLLDTIRAHLPRDVTERRHFEPFVGGGALFFALCPKTAVLSDKNADLINAYMKVRDNVSGLIRELMWLEKEHCKEAYYEVRELFNTQTFTDQTLRAAVFIYLNKTCFNGLQRKNKKGEFNVPIGSYEKPNILDQQTLLKCSAYLQRSQICLGSFHISTVLVQKNDFVYFDPPYDVPEGEQAFTSYDSEKFAREEQILVSWCFKKAVSTGAACLLSNADTPFIRELYKDFEIVSIEAPRSVGAKTREPAREVLVKNYANRR